MIVSIFVILVQRVNNTKTPLAISVRHTYCINILNLSENIMVSLTTVLVISGIMFVKSKKYERID